MLGGGHGRSAKLNGCGVLDEAGSTGIVESSRARNDRV